MKSQRNRGDGELYRVELKGKRWRDGPRGGQLPTVPMGKAVSDRRIWRQNAIAKALDVSFIRDWTPERGGVQKIIK